MERMNSTMIVSKRLFLISILAVFVMSSASAVNTVWGANLKVYFIDVSQGDCELIVSPTGKTVLIDAGNNGKGSSVVLPYLNNLGITDLDYIVASHYDADHIGGLDEVVAGLGGSSHILSAAYDRGGSCSSPTYTDYTKAVGDKRTTITPGQVIDLGGGAVLTCIAVNGKTKNGTIYSGKTENELSAAVKLDYQDFQAYFGGDSGQAVEGSIDTLVGNIDVYKVSHHGSDTSSSQSFLDIIQPGVSTIPVGSNSYGHPCDIVHTRLVNIGSYIYQTQTGNQAPPACYGEVANGSFEIVTDGCAYTVSGSGLSTATYATDGSFNCGGQGMNVVISEVLYDSRVYSETTGEWLELYNQTSSEVNIGGWTIADNSKSYTIPTGTTIDAHGYLVIAAGSAEFIREYGCAPHLADLDLRLNNDGDYLTLKNRGGTVMDQVAWGSGGGYVSGWGSTSQPNADEAKSIVRLNPDQDTDTYADWLSNQNPAPNSDGAPIIALNPTTINFEFLPGNYTDSQTFSINKSGCGTLNWSISDNAAWLCCSSTSGTDSGEVTVSVNTSGLTPGTYTGTVAVTAANASNSPQNVTVTLTILENPGAPKISLNRTALNYGAYEGVVTGAQNILISNTGTGTLDWSASVNANWLSCSPTSGTDSGVVTVSINADRSGLAIGTYSGLVSISDPNADNSPQTVTVTLTIHDMNTSPFGTFETPTQNSTVCSSIPVTGWVLDDIDVVNVKLYNGSDYIGDAVFVESARPDVELAYPGYPKNYQAGWGYMMLTNFLPNNGNGTFTLYAKATDVKGNEVTLGSKTIYVDNAHAVKPFGAIDTPSQGGAASGDCFINHGWALTPRPNSIAINGSTIGVYVDGVHLGSPTYNSYRSDIATLMPGYANSNGAGGYFSLDAAAFENGIHTIHWIATDSAGNWGGIGSRYFTVQNTGNISRLREKGQKCLSAYLPTYPFWLDDLREDNPGESVEVIMGYSNDGQRQKIYPGENGITLVVIKELERVEIHFPGGAKGEAPLFECGNSSFPIGSTWMGYRLISDRLSPLPTGATLDTERGVFYWQPGVGFIGTYEFIFLQKSTHWIKKRITIRIEPKF